ncbi:MAG TPA: putative Fe-S cluster assembly protein SufT [Gammaproteobacteria bacterium]|nr:putative Fe-S cluster assembly protein SufT [Gammaproteobacteria bacterium]
MRSNEIVTLSRDCKAVLIPFGNEITLPAGQAVTITQSLGGSYTCYVEGSLVRIAAQDADALGKQAGAAPEKPAPAHAGPPDENAIWDQLKTCYDPEIPINIVELGLIYGLQISPRDEGGYRVDIQMTLTAPGCGMGPILQQEVEEKARAVPGVSEVRVELVFEPAWDQSRMSEAAKLQSGLL